MFTKTKKLGLLVILLLVAAFCLIACEPVESEYEPPYTIPTDGNEGNIDHTTKDMAIDRVVNSLENLQSTIGSGDVGEGGYYLGFDFHINTENRSNFILKLKAHLFTYPYEDEHGNINPEALAHHNQLIKKSTLLIEWYDGITNSMLIGFYFDPVKSNPNNPGNILYLNVQGQKRWFEDFGDTVLYQQIIRLITNLDINRMLDSMGAGGEQGSNTLRELLDMAITNNYKLVINSNEETKKDVTSVMFSSVGLDVIAPNINTLVRRIFSAYEDKIDPATKKYLGFDFSVLGETNIRTLTTDALFFMEYDNDGIKELMTGADLAFAGVTRIDEQSVPFTVDINFFYGAAPPAPIELDKQFYKYFDYGKYEFTGELYFPTMNLRMDALIRTKLNNYDNPTNHFFGEFRDIANGDLLIGTYYKDELAYFDVEGLSHLYGGVHLEDIGLPKVYIEGWDVSKWMLSLKEFFEETVTNMVTNLLEPSDDSQSNAMKEIIMANMHSTKKDPDDPTSRNTVSIDIDVDLILAVMNERGVGTGNMTVKDLVNIFNAQLPITLDEVATILGITSAEVLLEKHWFKVIWDVDTNEITIQMYSQIGFPDYDPGKMIMQLYLVPVKFGEDMTIAEIIFDNFKPLLPIYTYSADMRGQFIFSLGEIVEFSELLSSFMDDVSGYNTKYILPPGTKLDFTLSYDQYIREQQLQTEPGGDRDGRWTRASRNAFILNVFVKGSTEEENVTLFNIYSDDVSFKTTVDGETENERLERLGYIWIDLVCLRTEDNPTGIPKFKIREDYWLQSVNRYMQNTGAADSVGTMLNPDVSFSITTIISALMEDSYIQFQPEQIEITTSNETVQNIFNVDQLIGNIAAQIGLVQRVFGLENIQDEFSYYTVGELENITALGPYYTKLHETIDVTFHHKEYDRSRIKLTSDIDSWEKYQKAVDESIILIRQFDETVPLKFMYEKNSITVRDEAGEYFPVVFGPIIESEHADVTQRFMGVNRGYKITMTGSANDKKLITSLANEDWTYLDMDGTYGEYIILDEELEFYRESNDETDQSLVTKYLKDKYDVYLNVERLIPHYRFEPLEDKPSKLDVNVGIAAPGIVSYPSDIKINWDSVTIDGGEYVAEAVIAEGMMGETHFPVHIVITNRRIDTTDSRGAERLPSYVNVLADEKSEERTKAPVVDEVMVNLYDYAWEKAIYLERFFYPTAAYLTGAEYDAALKQAGFDFVAYYFGNKEVRIKFVDPDPTVDDYRDTPDFIVGRNTEETENSGYLRWSFDKYEADAIYSESDIGTTAGETYLHANFKGRIIALKVIVESRTVIGVQFDGEPNINVYTVDVLDEATHTIPLYPYIVFAETDAGGMENIKMRLYDATYEVYAPMQWLYKVADNLDINGTDTPFSGSTSNVTSAFIDLTRSLKVAEWAFGDRSPLIQVLVDCPPKEVVPVGTRIGQSYEPTVISNVYDRMVYDSLGNEQWNAVTPISMTPDRAIMTTYLSKPLGEQEKYYGYYFVDPFDASTAELPTSLRVYFYQKNNTDERLAYYRDYNNDSGLETVKWKLAEAHDDTCADDCTNNHAFHFSTCPDGCTENHALIEYTNGKYVLRVNSNSETPRDLKLIALVGNTKVGYIEVAFCVRILSSKYTDITFKDADGSVIDATKSGEDSYTMQVSTFKGFTLPVSYDVTFGTDDIRSYSASWMGKDSGGSYTVSLDNIKFSPGSTINLGTFMTGKNGITLPIILIIEVINEELKAIDFTEMPQIGRVGDQGDISYSDISVSLSLANKELRIANIPVGADGKVQYVKFSSDGSILDMTVFDFLSRIFMSSVLTLDTRISDDTVITENLEKNLEIYNLKGLFSIGDVLIHKGTNMSRGITYTIRVGYGKGAYDLTVYLEFVNGLYPADTGESVIKIIPYDATGNALFGEGYVLGDEIAVVVTANNQTVDGNPPVYFAYGPDAPYGRLDQWYVESSNFASISVGSYITEISAALIYSLTSDATIEISILTEQGFRIKKALIFNRVNIGDQYDSVYAVSSDLFSIVKGLITIEDIYSYYPLTSYLSGTTYIPKTVKHDLGGFTITVNNITWRITSSWEAWLPLYTYKGITTFHLASASVLGWREITFDSEGREVSIWRNTQTINLYITIDDAQVYALRLEDSLNLLSDYEEITVTSASTNTEKQRINDLFNASVGSSPYIYTEFIVFMDAYENASYRGSFVPPTNLTVQYVSGVRHTFGANQLRYNYRGTLITAIPYDVSGILWQYDSERGEYYITASNTRVYRMAGDDGNNITLTVDLGAGQTIAVKFSFYDKTIEYVTPVIRYDDQILRNSITLVLAEEIAAARSKTYGAINLTRLSEQLGYVLKAVITARDSIDAALVADDVIALLYSDTLAGIEAKIASGDFEDMLRLVLDHSLTLYRTSEIVSGTLDGEVKTAYNYAAELINAAYARNLDAVIDDIISDGLAVLRNNEGASLSFIRSSVSSLYESIYATAINESINNKITDFVLPVVASAADSLATEEKYYTAALKNSVLASVDYIATLKKIENYRVQALGGRSTGISMYEWINQCLANAFNSALTGALNLAAYSADYRSAVETSLLARKQEMDAADALIVKVYDVMTRIYAGLSDIADVTSRKNQAWTNLSQYTDAADVAAYVTAYGAANNTSSPDAKWDGLFSDLENQILTSIPVEWNMSQDIIEVYFERLFAYRNSTTLLELAIKEAISRDLRSYVATIGDAVLAGLSINTGSRLNSAVSYAVNVALDATYTEALIMYAMVRAKNLNQTAEDGIYIIDPYGNYISVPSSVQITFGANGGYGYVTSFEWRKPAGWSTSQNVDAGVTYQGNEKTDIEATIIAWETLNSDIDLNEAGGNVEYVLLATTRNNLQNNFTGFVSGGGTTMETSLRLKLWSLLYYSVAGRSMADRRTDLEYLVANWDIAYRNDNARAAALAEIDEVGLTLNERLAVLEMISALSDNGLLSEENINFILNFLSFKGTDQSAYLDNVVKDQLAPAVRSTIIDLNSLLTALKARFSDSMDDLDNIYKLLINNTHDVADFGYSDTVIQKLPRTAAVFESIYARATEILASGATADAICLKSFNDFFAIYIWENMKVASVDAASTAVWSKVLLDLSRRHIAAKWNEFSSIMTSYGISSQNISIIVKVVDREIASTEFSVITNYTKESYTVDGVTHYIDAKHHITDPFAARVSDFPTDIYYQGFVGANYTDFTDMNIIWATNDLNISYRGTLTVDKTTGLMGVLVTGYIKNSRVGQPVTLRLIVDAWTYNDASGSGLKQYAVDGENPDVDNYLPQDAASVLNPASYVSNSGDYNIMSPINFVFSKLVDYSLEDVYLVTFTRTRYVENSGKEDTATDSINVLFYPENSTLLLPSSDDDMQAIINIRNNYVLYWDQSARSNAYNNGGAHTGNFSLGNDHKASFIKNGVANYEYEETFIDKLNSTGLTYNDIYNWYVSLGTANPNQAALTMYNSIFGLDSVSSIVVDPFDASLPALLDARGILNRTLNVDLGNVRVLWNKELVAARADLIAYIMYEYPVLSYSEAETSAMNMLMNVDRSEIELRALINSLSAWYISNWAAENGVTLPADYSEAWDVMYEKIAATSPSTLIKMQLLQSAMIAQYGNRGGQTLDEEWTYIENSYYYVRNMNDRTYTGDAEKCALYEALFAETSGVPASITSQLSSLYGRIYQQNSETVYASARTYEYYIGYVKWSQLMKRIEDLRDEGRAAYDVLQQIQASNSNQLSVFEQYTASWNSITSTLGAATADKVNGWNRLYSYVELRDSTPVLGEREKSASWETEYTNSTSKAQMNDLLAYAESITPAIASATVSAFNIYSKHHAWLLMSDRVASEQALVDELNRIKALYTDAALTTYEINALAYDALVDTVAKGGMVPTLLATFRPHVEAVTAMLNEYYCYLELKALATPQQQTTLTTIELTHSYTSIIETYSMCWRDARDNYSLGDGIYTLADANRVKAWTDIYSVTQETTPMYNLLQNQKAAYNAIVKSRAVAYDLYVKHQHWLRLKEINLTRQSVYAELVATENAIRAAYGENTGEYLVNAFSWDKYGEEFVGESLVRLNQLLGYAAENDLLKGNEISAKAWDLWLKGKTYEKWLESIAKGYLMIDEVYDIHSSYDKMGGGIEGQTKVTLMLQMTEDGYIYTQTFTVRMIYLDMTPIVYRSTDFGANIAGIEYDESTGKILTPLTSLYAYSKVNYRLVNDINGKNDYTGRINPYDNNQSQLVEDMINCYTYTNLSREQINIVGNSIDAHKILYTDIEWDIPAGSKKGDTVRSKSFTVNGTVYYSDMLVMALI